MPRPGTLLVRVVTLRCPWCGGRGLVHRWFGFADRCPNCGLATERTEGHWVGALGMNTIVSFGLLMATLLISFLVSWPDPPPGWTIGLALTVAIGVPVALIPFARLGWLAVDVAMRPPEPHELHS